MFQKIYGLLAQSSKSAYSSIILAILFFAEAIFFIPVDPVLIVFCTEDRNRSLWYGLVATIASVAGGITSYYLGFLLWESIGVKLVNLVSSMQTFNLACTKFQMYEHWVVLVAGFTPFPYKIVTLSAGFCKLPLLTFIACSLISRGARFMLIAGIIKLYGHQIKGHIERYFNHLVILFTIIFLGGFFVLR